MRCPACGTGMEQVSEPDVEFEKCPQCAGVFLSAGELNALLTGMPGDIEHCSLGTGTPHADRFSKRLCPKCPQQEMRKENLLQHSEIVFDYCERCHGWFLDRGELARANAVLNEIRSGEAEYRGRHKDRLVTLVKVPVFVSGAVGPLGFSNSTMVTWDRVDAYFDKPLSTGLRISPETWLGKLWGLLGVHDVSTGDAVFDREFRIRAEDPDRAVAALSTEAREAILRFVRSPLCELGKKHRFEVLDDRVVFCFTDWGVKGESPTESEKRALFDALAETAAAID